VTDYIHRTEALTLEMRRCHECGRYWAFDSFHSPSRAECPACAGRQITRLYKRIGEMERTIIALKGALTKAKK